MRRVHFDISTEAFWRSACGATPTEDGTNLTLDDAQVTCRKCLAAMGYEPAPLDQLTVCQPDPMRRAA